MPSFDEVRAELLKILGQISFGEDVIVQRYTGTHYARGLQSIDEAVPGLTTLDEKTLGEVYKLGRQLAKLDPEMAFYYFKTCPEAIKHFSFEDMKKWVEMGIALFEGYGVVPARNFFKGITRETIQEIHSVGLDFEDVSQTLSLYIDALSAGTLKIEKGEESYTDTRMIFLPKNISLFEEDEKNFKLYKAIAAHKYGQLRYRSFDISLRRIEDVAKHLSQKYGRSPLPESSDLENFFHFFPNKRLALDIFGIVENARVERYLRREFKGLSRDLDFFVSIEWAKRPSFASLSRKEAALEALMQLLTKGETKEEISSELEPIVQRSRELVEEMLSTRATAEDSARVTAQIYELIEENLGGAYTEYQNMSFRGVVKPERITVGIKQSQKELLEKMKKFMSDVGMLAPPDMESKVQELLNQVFDPLQHGAPLEFMKRFGVDLPEEIKEELLREIEKQLGELGELDVRMLTKVLDSAGLKLRAGIQSGITHFQVELTEEDMAGAFLYDEWDYKIGNYRAAWCALKEKTMPKGSDRFVDKTLEKHSGLVTLIRRQFEMMRPEYKRLFRQIFGDDVDIDAFIEAFSDLKAGATPSEKLYIKIDKKERDIAVAFLVDLSGSTTGWVIETEKEALVLMCEALEVLKDKYAIFGFSGKTRKQCDFYVLKSFDEDYCEEVKNRISGMEAFDYTRMGPPIRHLTEILDKVEAKIKIMVILSDGKPEDFDEYKGEHGIEDTRKALIEAKRKHIRPFCITVDTEARDYMPHMFGEVSYIILDDVRKLPRKLPEIYRKLTT